MGALQQLETRAFGRVGWRPPQSLLGRLAVWLALFSFLSALGHLLPGVVGAFFLLLELLSVSALVCVLVPLVWRLTVGRVLWKVQNRLVATYLLMGLAPLVLFLALFGIAAYILLGQFAVFAASSELVRLQQGLAAKNLDYAMHLAASVPKQAAGGTLELPERAQPEVLYEQRPIGETEFRANGPASDEPQQAPKPSAEQPRVAAFLDGKPLPLALPASDGDTSVKELPGWLPVHFEGWVFTQDHFAIRVADKMVVGPPGQGSPKHWITVVSTLPVDQGSIERLAAGLGRITVAPETFRHKNEENTTPLTSEAKEQQLEAATSHAVSGGTLRAAKSVLDVPVNFFVPLDTTDWVTGKESESGVRIVSRPTLLYERLFITSLQVANFVHYVLLGLAIFFGVLELVAFAMAVRLNQTITRSIRDLYAATLALDRREFAHRIEVTRKDQLAALSSSFNAMASSLERLVEEQREKERLQGELEIAQQVQANLFPQGQVSLPHLEVFGICQPARTVSGDYYDFLISGSCELSIALGDISGKGISAALLMATLHSAVHAYRFAGEDARQAGQDGSPMLAASFAEPGQILGLLNRHLYRSTQPEKYATLFLAHYDERTAELTYSTGGQLPPLLVRATGEVVRLDCGGTVIGLMDGASYDQGREKLEPGDIVVAYSDGVTEPENEFGEFGEERLLELVRQHRSLPLDAIAERLLQALRSWIGTAEQPDDITLVLARQR